MTARQLPQGDYLALKATFRELVKLVGSETHAAKLTRVSQQHVGRYGSVADDWAEYFAPIDVIADLEAEVGPIVTRELARLSNHVVVELPRGMTDVRDLGRISGRAMKETADVFARLGTMLDDGVLSAVEGRHLLKEIDEAIMMLATLRLMALAVSQAGEDGR